MDFNATGGGSASLDELVSMTIIGFVVEVNSEDFNVASILSSVNRQLNGGGASFQTSVENFVSGSSGDTSRFDVDSAGQRVGCGRRSPLAVNNFSGSCVGDGVLASQVLEILGRKGSLGISRISFLTSGESSGLTAIRIHTNYGDGISGISGQVGQIDLLEEGGVNLCGSSSWSDGHDPGDAPSCGILPSQTQIIDMVGVVRSESTTGELIGKICGWRGNWCADRVGVRSR